MGVLGSSRTEVYLHLVWATWDRLPLLTSDVQPRIYNCLRVESARLKGEVLAIGGIEDHVHLLVRMPATVALSSFVKQLKGASSHLANHEIGGCAFKWQGGYAAFSVSRRLLPKVVDYIRRQEEHHRTGVVYAEVEPGPAHGDPASRGDAGTTVREGGLRVVAAANSFAPRSSRSTRHAGVTRYRFGGRVEISQSEGR